MATDNEIMLNQDRRALADEVIAAAGNCRFDDELEGVKRSEEHYNNIIGAELLYIDVKARNEKRERLHADEQRQVDRLKRERDDVQRAVFDAERRIHSATATMQRKVASATRPGDDTVQGRSAGDRYAWKSIVPSMREYRAASINSDPGGGYLVNSTIGPFFDRLRPLSVVLAAEPRIEPCDSDSLLLPGLSSSVTVAATGEASSITESSPQFQQLRIPMRKYAAYTLSSSELLDDSRPGARQIIETDHRLQLAAKLDLDMLQGNGAGNNLQGLRYQGTATSLATNGATPSLSNIVDAIYRLEANNAQPSAIFMHPRTWNTLRKLVDGQSRYQLAPTPAEAAPKNLFGLPVFLSSQMTITETIGTSTDCSWIAVVDMSRIVVAQRQEMTVLYDPFTYAKNDQVAIRTTTRWGMGVLDVAAVEVLTGVRP